MTIAYIRSWIDPGTCGHLIEIPPDFQIEICLKKKTGSKRHAGFGMLSFFGVCRVDLPRCQGLYLQKRPTPGTGWAMGESSYDMTCSADEAVGVVHHSNGVRLHQSDRVQHLGNNNTSNV